MNAAVVGLGVGEQHARALKLIGCELSWLYDLDAERSDQLQKEIGAKACATQFETLLNDADLDLIVLASFDDAHFEQVIPALKAKKHLFIEKPLCRSLQELTEVKATWLAHGQTHLMSNLVLRAAPIYRWLRQAIQEGELGRIYAIDGDYLFGRLHKITEGWRKDVVDYSVMQGGGVHLLDLMLWLTQQRPQTVSAVGNRICTEDTDFHYRDYVASTYTFASGMVGRITANFGCVHKHQHVLRVFGTEATFVLDDQGPRLHKTRDPESEPQRIDLAVLPAHKGDLIPGFVRAILKNEDSLKAAQHEFDLISACVAADEALHTQANVEIEYS